MISRNRRLLEQGAGLSDAHGQS
jgi:hypothetical protein